MPEPASPDARAGVPTDRTPLGPAGVRPVSVSATGVAVQRARTATYVAFAGSGMAGASWATRIPQVRDHLHLDSSALGLMLLSIAVGSVLALPVSGHLTDRFGSRRVVIASAWLLAFAFLLVAVGYRFGEAPVVAGLFLFGFACGTWDVAMNVQGALVERLLGRSIMSRFHAGFSLGTVAGALAGAAVVALRVPVAPHLVAIALVVAVCVPMAARAMLPDDADQADAARHDAPDPAEGAAPPARRRVPHRARASSPPGAVRAPC